MNTYFNVKRAREEIECLNVEIPRLFTFILDEHADFYEAISRTCVMNLALAHELSLRWQYWDRINGKIMELLHKTSQLPGFTGQLQSGHRVGRVSSNMVDADISFPSWAALCIVPDSDEDVDDETIPGVDNEQDEEGLVQFFDGLGREELHPDSS
ncbi:hypothetical protein A0H81_14855 [Grifola frondosa]|uniref:Uncharacterized protein n=1 Tax=Grifola frondosa TaxID=5627 RepID=A0A1C7LLU6_GRIFR|nr:hypothetical protein A0H81_14855 [Grifola frondosa]